MTERVRMTFMEPGGVAFASTPAFLVQPKGWIQRACWWWLRRRSAAESYFRQDVLVREIVIDPDQLARQVIAKARHQFRLHPGMPNPQRVLLGRKQFAELMGDPVIGRELIPRQTIHGNVEVFRGAQEPFTLLGLDIEVIPHMDGILVL